MGHGQVEIFDLQILYNKHILGLYGGKLLVKLICVVVRYKILPYVGQDTNATIERYCKTLNFQLKVEKSKMVGHHTDQCIHELTQRLYLRP
jgi:hypothetical protein